MKFRNPFKRAEKSSSGMSSSGIPISWPTNWWQIGRDQPARGGVSIVHACVDAYAQAMATLWAYHYKRGTSGEKEPITTTALSRLLHRPNSYQTQSDFMLNLVKGVLLKGNGYVYGLRNDRNEFTSLHLMPPQGTMPYVDSETQSIFYAFGENPILGKISAMIPARDVMHIRLYCPRHPLVGVSPIEHAALSIATNQAISSHQTNFFTNMSRPSGVLSTDMKLSAEQMKQLRSAWEEQSTKMDTGGIPILASGIKWEPMALSAIDAQIVDSFNMTIVDVARSFRVPLPLVQHHDEGSTYNNVEQLYSQWLSGGLGFMIEHIEQNYNGFFDLSRNEGTEFDPETLLRTDFKGKVEGYTKGIQGGLFTPNEGRKKFNGLAPVPHGDVAYMQQQMVPLGYVPEEPEPVPESEPEPELDEDEARGASIYYLKKVMNDD